jgi:hypothetical protein
MIPIAPQPQQPLLHNGSRTDFLARPARVWHLAWVCCRPAFLLVYSSLPFCCVIGPRFSGGFAGTPTPCPSPAGLTQPYAPILPPAGEGMGRGHPVTPAEAGACYTAVSWASHTTLPKPSPGRPRDPLEPI